MSDAFTSELINLPQLTTGRRRFAYRRIAPVLAKVGASALADFVEQGIAKDEAAATVEQRYYSAQAKQEGPRADAQRIDYRLDRVIGAIHNSLGNVVSVFDAATDEAQQARRMQVELYPRGAVAITTASFEDELGAATDLVAKLRGPFASDAQRLGLGLLVDELERVTGEFRAALAETPSEPPRFDQVREARRAAQAHLERFVVKVLASDDFDDAARARVLAPVIEQAERVRSLRARRRTVPDVDPSTGTEQAPESTGVGPAET